MAGLTLAQPDSMYRVAWRATVGALADGWVFSMRNLSATKTVFIKRVKLRLLFTGLAGATANSVMLTRFDTATPTAGTAITPALLTTGYNVASVVTDVRYAAGGLTAGAAAVKNAPLAIIDVPILNATAAVPYWEFNYEWKRGSISPHAIWDEELTLAPHATAANREGLALLTIGTPTASTAISCEVVWTEATAA